jgi:protein SCO1
MRSLVVFLSLLFCSQAVYAAGYVKKTDKGLFSLEVSTSGKGLQNGVNSLDIIVRDKSGKSAEGAEITVTPWLPAMGQGVWEKSVVTVQGAGKYHVQNIVTTLNGRWELKIDIRKGAVKDRAVFSFDVTGAGPATRKEADLPRGKYDRSVQNYRIPSITLLNQDGKKVNLRLLVDSGKPVIFDFIYTTCTTICPVLSATFTNLRKDLGVDADKVQLISISIDPEHDRPELMKKYLARFRAGKGWDFLTGSREDINMVLKSLDATLVDKMAHEPLYIMHGPNSGEWVRIKGLLTKGDLLNELKRMEHK